MSHVYTMQPLDSHRVGTVASSGNVCDVGAIHGVVGRGVVLVVAGDDDVTGGNVRRALLPGILGLLGNESNITNINS